jgi:hypothetical protein
MVNTPPAATPAQPPLTRQERPAADDQPAGRAARSTTTRIDTHSAKNG